MKSLPQSIDFWRTPCLYITAACLLVAAAAAFFFASLSASATLLLSRLGIDPFVTTEQCAGGFVVALVLAISPGLRGMVTQLVIWLRSLPVWRRSWSWAKGHYKDGKEPPKAAWDVLALLRFWLAFIVAVWHLHGRVYLPPFLDSIWQFGPETAVMAFLVISGFSMAHSIERDRKDFYTRRAIRIYPAYIFSVVLMVLPLFLFRHQISMTPKMIGTTTPGLVEYLGHFRYYSHLTTTPITGHTISITPVFIIGTLLFLQGLLIANGDSQNWSLAVEVYHYALTPWFRKLASWVLVGWIVVSALVFWNNDAWRLGIISPIPGHRTILMSWAWVLGFVYYRHRNSLWANILLLASVPFCTHYVAQVQSFQTFELLAAVLIGNRFLGAVPPIAGAVMRWLGDVSYPAYIIQGQVYGIAFLAWRVHSAALYLLILLAASIFTLHIIDNPAKTWLKRAASRRREVTPRTAIAGTRIPQTDSPR